METGKRKRVIRRKKIIIGTAVAAAAVVLAVGMAVLLNPVLYIRAIQLTWPVSGG